MLKTRAVAAVAALSMATCAGTGAALVAASPAASAQTPSAQAAQGPVRTTGLTTTIPCSGATTSCTLTVTAFHLVGNTIQAVGTVTNGVTTTSFTTPLLDPASCHVLSLTLGPLHLNLLGLVVDLNQVNLNVTAQPGPGNLLGNLLCSVTHLLDNTSASTSALNGLLATINGILAGL